MTPRLTIQIVGWNSAATLTATAKALSAIPSDFASVRYIDNNSTDNSVAIIKQHLAHADIIELDQNKGFAEANNIGFSKCTTPFVLALNPDFTINFPALKQLLRKFANPKLGAVQGKLMRHSLNEKIIDSAGIVLTLALNGRDRGANEVDRGQYNKPARLIAVTGACALYRLSALKEVAHSHDEIFDKDFFAYKEDVDLGWRLNNAGWQVKYYPITMGTHHRALGARGFLNWGLNPTVIYNRLKSPRTRYSFRNWFWCAIKNATAAKLITHGIFLDLRSLAFIILSLMYPPLFTVWPEIFKKIPAMMAKRSARQ